VSAGEPGTFSDYLTGIQRTLNAGHASEGSHYPILKTLLEAIDEEVVATSLPSRIECGAPDFVVSKGALAVGCVEAKDVGRSLDEAERS